MCCDTTNASVLIRLSCYNPFADDPEPSPEPTETQIESQSISPLWLAFPSVGFVTAGLLLDNRNSFGYWQFLSVLEFAVFGASFASYYGLKIQDKTWLQGFAASQVLELAFWELSNNDDNSDNSRTTYSDLAVHVISLTAAIYGMMTFKDVSNDLMLPVDETIVAGEVSEVPIEELPQSRL